MNREIVERLRISEKRGATRFEKLLAISAILVILALGISSLLESRGAESRTKVLSDVETPAASIIFTQRETLVYSTRLALWSNGGTTRREVQIARALLAQRLAVVDSSGRSMGSRARPGYWDALNRADDIVADSPAGILPESQHSKVNKLLLPVIDEIIFEARELVVSYQRSVDSEMSAIARETAYRDSLNLALFYLAMILGGLFLWLNTRRNYENLRSARGEIERERGALADAERRVAQLQDLDAAKSALISNVNHELRTPLTSIIGYIELLQRESSTHRTPEESLYLEVLQRNSMILLNLVESLLSLSKFDSGVGKLPNEPVSINEVIDNAIFTLQPALEVASIDIEVDTAKDLYVRGDGAQLNQVLINLIANAIKFSRKDSSIHIGASATSENGVDWVTISIKDYGIGIPQEELSLIFNRFFRGSNIDPSLHQGTGLGLAIVEQVIHHHGGKLDVTSEIGSGSTFSILLPQFGGVKKNGE